ncbi:hypothetical protein DH2020_018213 [Rehmannia glutinosa]|uniref:digalactosyldiacylglycerol synthase n=1 Tax=Rehmannia glutinosa TaxID=99300 RepID=A0ABR0WL17_REHGL
MNFKPPEAWSASSTVASSGSSSSIVTAEKALSFISKGWREVRSSADADLQLLKNRANSFKNLADRELENFINSASKSPFSVPTITASATLNPAPHAEIDFVKKLQPKLSEIRRAYSSPDFRFYPGRRLRLIFRIEINLQGSNESKEVPPLDVPELLACLVRQSSPLLDQLGINRGISDKIVESLCGKRKSQLLLRSLPAGESSMIESDNINDELDLRIASVLQSTGHCHEGGFGVILENTNCKSIVRAAYLANSAKQNVTLLVPWLCRSDQELVYPNNLTFSSPEEQESYIRSWLEERIGFKADFKISFYPGKVLRLSAATQELPKSVICNVHGVNPKFLKIGEKVAAEKERYKELIDLLAKHKKDLDGFNLGVYGNGEDAHEVQSTAKRLNLNLNFMKGRDHADDSLQGYKIFVNPSVSDVLCTATAEALAMGKFVVCADHPSNDFFRAFPNCLTYKTPEDFVAKVKEAMANEPQPLTPEQRYHLSWEAATQRFMEYSELDKMEDWRLRITASLESEFLRLCTGAIPRTRDYDKQHCEDLHLLPPQGISPRWLGLDFMMLSWQFCSVVTIDARLWHVLNVNKTSWERLAQFLLSCGILLSTNICIHVCWHVALCF